MAILEVLAFFACHIYYIKSSGINLKTFGYSENVEEKEWVTHNFLYCIFEFHTTTDNYYR